MRGISDPEVFLRELFRVAVDAADPMLSVPRNLPEKPIGRVVILGAGKASARMAEALETVWGPCEGLVITRYGYARPCRGVEIVEAAHPVPDEAGLLATRRLLDLAGSLREGDHAVALISGGASALLVAPAGNITLAEKQAVNAALLASGAPIGEMNIVRKHLSCIKGGQLAAATYPARLLSLLISDVPGDDPALIGSGPTVGDKTTTTDAASILAKWKIVVPNSVNEVLSQKSFVFHPDATELQRTNSIVIAAPSQSLAAAATHAELKMCEVRTLGDRIEGEAREVAAEHAQLALELQRGETFGGKPHLLLSGGELTVTRRGAGVGGPNAEYALALACELEGAEGIYAIACDTDGVDGAADVAGAVIGPKTLQKARLLDLDAKAHLSRNDSHTFFGLLGDQVVTGPTLTNVNDFRAILIL